MERRLVDLKPEWTYSRFSHDHPHGYRTNAKRRCGTAFWCACPCGCRSSLLVPFANPLDGGPPDPCGAWGNIGFRWVRQGDSFADLSVSPSIDIVNHWHGWITQGLVIQC